MPIIPPPAVSLTPGSSGQNLVNSYGNFCPLTLSVSGLPFDSNNPFNITTAPNAWLYNSQASGGMVVIGVGGDPRQNTGPKLLFGALGANNPFDITGRCWFWSDPSNGVIFLDQVRLRLDGDGQLTINTRNTHTNSVENNLLIVHTPLSGLVSQVGIGVGIQFRTQTATVPVLGRDLGFINAVSTDVSSGNFSSRLDFYNSQAGSGTLGFSLHDDGTVVVPSKITAGVLTQTGGLVLAQRTTFVSTALTTSDYYLWVNTSASGIVVTLPTAVGNGGSTFVVKKVDIGINTVTVIPPVGGQTIDLQSSIVWNTPQEALGFASDNINWNIF